MTKNGYYRNDGFIFAWDLGVIFLGIRNWAIGGFLKMFYFDLGLKVVIEKCVVSLYTYF